MKKLYTIPQVKRITFSPESILLEGSNLDPRQTYSTKGDDAEYSRQQANLWDSWD